MVKSVFDLDMTPGRMLPLIINVSQYDDIGRTIVFNLYSSVGAWTAPTSASVTFEGGKPDGKFFAYNCAYSSGTATVTIQQQMTAVAGKVRCKIKVTSGSKVVESASIIMVVDAAAVPDGSDMSKTDINDAVANATQKIVDQVKDNIPSDYAQLSTDVSSLKEDKVDYTFNIARISNLQRDGALDATFVKNDDGSVTVTPTQTYGRYDFSYKIPSKNNKRYFYVCTTISKDDTTVIPQNIIYCYKGSSNLSTMKNVVSKRINVGKQYVLTEVWTFKDNQYETTRLDIGVITNTGISYTISSQSLLMIDITDIFKEISTDNILDKCVYFFGTEYKEKFVTAETAETAETAKTAETAETLLFSLVNRGSTDFSLVGNDGCTFTPTQTYYGFQIRPKFAFSKNGKILLVIETDFYSNDTATFVVGQQKAGGSGYENTIWLTFYKKIEDKYIYYCMLPITTNGANSIDIYHGSELYVGTPHTVTIKKIGYAISDSVTDRMIRLIVNNETLLDLYNSVDELVKSTEKTTNSVINTWKNKKVLAIGDSITAAQKWQKKLNEMLEMNVYTHAKGGVGTVAMVDGDKGLGGDYDNETSASGTLKPLSVDDVKDKDLIVVLPAYNDRGKADGTVGDCYNPSGSGQNTIAGVVQYTINRIYEELTNAGNLKCKILYATPHCAGRYPYIDADGYDEYPSGTGRTMETLANTIVAVCNHNNIPVCDLWHNSGSNKYTWNIIGSSSSAVNNQYSPYKLDSEGKPTSSARIRYVKGQSYYQVRNGEVVLEEYTGSAPFPYNADQLHCSAEGYARLGECIVGAVIAHYGN
nr:MAG TPA: hypothetical protein [Caudoviricetes sp.]